VLSPLGILIGCGKAAPTPSAPYGLNAPVSDLRAVGTTVQVTQHQVDGGFAVKGQRIEVDGLPISVYEFADEQAMEDAASGVSADSQSITGRRAENGQQAWMHSDWADTLPVQKGTADRDHREGRARSPDAQTDPGQALCRRAVGLSVEKLRGT
jgi:hypothetical protein